MTSKNVVTFDETGRIEKAAPLRLTTMEQIKREMGHVYRDMRSGKIEPATGTRLVYVLGELVKVTKVMTEQGGGGLDVIHQIKGFEVVSGESDAL